MLHWEIERGERRVDTSLFFLYVLSKANDLTKRNDPEREEAVTISGCLNGREVFLDDKEVYQDTLSWV
jgi:hypothetical protein